VIRTFVAIYQSILLESLFLPLRHRIMSLSSILLPGKGKSKKQDIDKELDSFFTVKPPAVVVEDKKKRKVAKDASDAALSKTEKPRKKRRTETVVTPEPEAEPEPTTEAAPEPEAEVETGAASSDSAPLVHESLSKKKSSSNKKPSFVIPADDNRDARTIFIGNLSVEVAKKRVRPSNLSKTRSYSFHLAITETTTKTHPLPLPRKYQSRILPISLCSIQSSHLQTSYRSRSCCRRRTQTQTIHLHTLHQLRARPRTFPWMEQRSRGAGQRREKVPDASAKEKSGFHQSGIP
jgi:hypothetical protein